jgi:hypothetical protein
MPEEGLISINQDDVVKILKKAGWNDTGRGWEKGYNGSKA